MQSDLTVAGQTIGTRFMADLEIFLLSTTLASIAGPAQLMVVESLRG
jgi:hypothetical protein